MQISETDAPPQIRAVTPADHQLLADVVALGDRFRSRLGFLPPAAYQQAAAAGTLLAAMSGARLVGYTLYGLPGDRVRLSHLCVEPSHRGTGVNRLLVEEISRRHRDRMGISLKCRRDYGLDRMWSRLGFEPRNEVDGRGKTPTSLVIWWRDHGHPHLFTDAEPAALLQAAMDCNVFADLHASHVRTGAPESRVLSAPWITGLVGLVVLPQLIAEINNIAETAERRSQLRAAQSYTRLRPDASRADGVVRALIEAAWESLGLHLPRTPNDLGDLRYVAEAAVAGVGYLVTRDEKLLQLSEVAEQACSVRILRPSDVVLHIDELTRAQVYQPGRLLGTSLTATAVPAGREQEQLVFLNRPGGERQSGFKARLRDFAAQPDRWERQEIVDGQGRLLATYCHGVRGDELQVPFLRVVEGEPLGATLARQILFMLRQRCREAGVEVLRLSDPYPQRVLRLAAQEDAFQPVGSDLVALVLEEVGGTALVSEHAARVAARLGMVVPRLEAPLPAAAASAVERAWWPVKITDAELPSFLVPIKPKWAYGLFGVPAGLIPRDDRLGLSREHVYYRAARSRGEQFPARVLWYASAAKTHALSCVIGCSRLDSVVVGHGNAVHQRFKHLGVYHKEDVLNACDDQGRVMALRFSDTEIFPRFVPFKRLVQLGARHGQRVNVQSVFKISPDLFHALYEEGRQAR